MMGTTPSLTEKPSSPCGSQTATKHDVTGAQEASELQPRKHIEKLYSCPLKVPPHVGGGGGRVRYLAPDLLLPPFTSSREFYKKPGPFSFCPSSASCHPGLDG